MRTTALAWMVAACATAAVAGARQAGNATLCDTLAARVRSQPATPAAGTTWSRLTAGAPPLLEVATVPELSLDLNPAADERVQFEKRFRALYGNAEAVLKELRTWDNFDILALPGSAVRMLLTTSGAAACESRMFFRVTASREVVRVPDPPATGANDAGTALCETRGGWGYFARVSGAEAFVEYRAVDGRESIRVVPLTSAGWQTPCTVVLPVSPAARP